MRRNHIGYQVLLLLMSFALFAGTISTPVIAAEKQGNVAKEKDALEGSEKDDLEVKELDEEIDFHENEDNSESVNEAVENILTGQETNDVQDNEAESDQKLTESTEDFYENPTKEDNQEESSKSILSDTINTINTTETDEGKESDPDISEDDINGNRKEDDSTKKSSKDSFVESFIYEAVRKDVSLQDDRENLFEEYIQQEIEATQQSTSSDGMLKARKKTRLNVLEAEVYSILKNRIEKIASGQQASTELTISLEDLGLSDTTYSAADLEINSIVDENGICQDAVDAMYEKCMNLDMVKIVNELLVNCPYSFYWFDKTQGYSYSLPGLQAVYEEEYKLSFLGDIEISFCVASEFALDTYTVDESVGETVQTVSENIALIVERYRNVTDREKLEGYLYEICNAVSYNDEAANNNDTPYGNPWQLLWVFDDDPTTSVVCEGYSKAFKQLCDLTSFDNEKTEAIIVTGTMYGGIGEGKHMWNLVTLEDGLNYLVDVTNCDEGTIGAPDVLFLVRASDGSIQNGYSFKVNDTVVVYDYDESTLSTYYKKELVLSSAENLEQWITITVQPESISAFSGEEAELHVAYDSDVTDDVRVQWQYTEENSNVWTDIIGAEQANVKLTLSEEWNGRFIKCLFTDDMGHSAETDIVSVNVLPPFDPDAQCGDRTIWSLSEDGTLTISGYGDMWAFISDDREPDERERPWDGIRDQIRHIVIENGVTGVGKCAFRECKNLETVTFADSVATIGHMAFLNDTSLQNFSFPPEIRVIGDKIITGCESITHLTIPDTFCFLGSITNCKNLQSVSFTGGNPEGRSVSYCNELFMNCPSLREIEVANDHSVFKSVDGVLFDQYGGLITYPAAKEGKSYTVPEETMVIYDDAFDTLRYLRQIIIPNPACSFAKINNEYSAGHTYCSLSTEPEGEVLEVYGWKGSEAEKFADAQCRIFRGHYVRFLYLNEDGSFSPRNQNLIVAEDEMTFYVESSSGIIELPVSCTSGLMDIQCNDLYAEIEDGEGPYYYHYAGVNRRTSLRLYALGEGFDLAYKDITLNILPRINISNASAIFPEGKILYTGEEIEPDIIFTYEGEELTENVDYTIEFSDNIGPGIGQYFVHGIGKFNDIFSGDFEIVPRNLNDDCVSVTIGNHEDSVVYNGEAQEPDINVEYDGIALTRNVDYYVEYYDNIMPGTATIYITGNDPHILGTIEKHFVIEKLAPKIDFEQKVSYQSVTSIPYYNPLSCTSNGELSFVSNNTDVAEVDAVSGQVTLKRAGTAVITVHISESDIYNAGTASYTLHILNELDLEPITVLSYNKLNLCWKEIPEADGYLIYRKNDGEAYVLVKSIPGSDTTSLINKVESGIKYSYLVYAYKIVEGEKQLMAVSMERSETALPSAPVMKSAGMAAFNKIKVIWTKVSGCAGYVIYRSTEEDGQYSVLKTVTMATATEYSNIIQDGQTYYYKIRAFVEVNGKKVYGDYSEVLSGDVIDAPPANFRLEQRTATKIIFNWDKVEDCEGYVIYRYFPDTDKCKAIKNITSNDTLMYSYKVEADTDYQFTMRAYRVVNGKKVYSDYTGIIHN